MPRGSGWHKSRADDEQYLRIMHLIDAEGQTMASVAARTGMTRSSVAGRVKRIRDTYQAQDFCRKPENRDGGMPERWWANGA
jgi:hypothetical protein